MAKVDPVAVVREALIAHGHGRTTLPAEYALRWTTPGAGGSARSLGLPAAVQLRHDASELAVGVKIINANPDNVRRGLARANGVVALFDPETADIRSLLDGAAISASRTAAVTALAVDLLGASHIERVLVVGAGILAEYHMNLLVPRLPGLLRVDLVDSNRPRAEVLADRVRRLSVDVAVVDDVHAVARNADLIVTVTTTTTPYLGLNDIAPGATVVNVSLDDLDADLLLGADRLIVDDWELVSTDRHRLLGQLAGDGLVVGPRALDSGVRRVDAELADIVTGRRRGRLTKRDVIVVNPFGMAIFDIALGRAIELRGESEGMFLPAW